MNACIKRVFQIPISNKNFLELTFDLL